MDFSPNEIQLMLADSIDKFLDNDYDFETRQAIAGGELPVYGDGLQTRNWIHVLDHCRALLAVLKQGEVGRIYSISGDDSLQNVDVAGRILKQAGQTGARIAHVADRPGHDRRYALSTKKIEAELGWQPQETFATGMRKTIEWYLANERWWRRILSGDYLVRRSRAAAAAR